MCVCRILIKFTYLLTYLLTCTMLQLLIISFSVSAQTNIQSYRQTHLHTDRQTDRGRWKQSAYPFRHVATAQVMMMMMMMMYFVSLRCRASNVLLDHHDNGCHYQQCVNSFSRYTSRSNGARDRRRSYDGVNTMTRAVLTK